MTVSVRRIIRKFEWTTQQMREDLVEDLKKLMDQAVKEAYAEVKLESHKKKHLREWSRLAAYIGQTINAILKEYDEKEIKQRLERIEQKMEELGKKRGQLDGEVGTEDNKPREEAQEDRGSN